MIALKFMDALSAGLVQQHEIDDYIDRWNALADPSLPLHEFLGMTRHEYASWVEQPKALESILKARLKNSKVAEQQPPYGQKAHD